MLGVATALGAGMIFVTQTLLARTLGPSVYGLFASSLATVTMIAPLAGFGLTQFRLKVYGVEGWDAQRWLLPSLRFVAFTTALSFSLVIGWALLFAPADGTRFALLTLSPVIFSILAVDLAANKLRLEDRYASMALWQLAIPGSRMLAAAILLIAPALGERFVMLCYGAIAIAVSMAALPQLRVLLRDEMALTGHGPRPASGQRLASPGIAELWSQAWAYGVTAALYPIFFQISTVLLKYLAGNDQAGLYGVGLAVMTAIYLIPATIYQKFLLSKLHRWAAHDRPKFAYVWRRGNQAMLALGLLVGAALAGSAPWLVPMVFGDEFRPVAGILMILAICVPVRFLSTAIGAALLTGTHMRYRVYATVLATVAVIALDVVLIPRFGTTGAAWATVVGEAVLLVAMYGCVRRFARPGH